MSRRSIFALSFAVAVVLASSLAYLYLRKATPEPGPLYVNDMLVRGKPRRPQRESMAEFLKDQALKEGAKMKAAKEGK